MQLESHRDDESANNSVKNKEGRQQEAEEQQSPLLSIVDRLTVATVLINGNYHFSSKELVRILNAQKDTRSYHVIISNASDHRRLPFPVKSVHKVPSKHAFDHSYEHLRTINFLNKFGVTR
jgi:hypothetical protein